MLDPAFHGIRGGRNRLLNRGPLRWAEAREDVVDGVHPRRRTTDAHAEPREVLASQGVDDGLEPVVAAGAPSGPEANGAEGEVHVVDDDQEIIQAPNVVALAQERDGRATRVHHGGWL